MTDLSKTKYLKRFKILFEQKNQREISDAEALEYFEKLVSLVGAVFRPIPKNYQELTQQHGRTPDA
jgi:hypothetical protein